ncbi:hypothetical protein V1506DRAFT_323349 [Lipomyces tetrasporus]
MPPRRLVYRGDDDGMYRSDDDGNVNLVDNVKDGFHLLGEAKDLFRGGFSFKLAEAKDLYAGAASFFRSFKHMEESQPEGLDDYSAYSQEHKLVTMFSDCRDDQTSADASINGTSEGAMSWAFLEIMKRIPYPTYLQALQDTRNFLRQSDYTQVPQLSVGLQMDLNQGLVLRVHHHRQNSDSS